MSNKQLKILVLSLILIIALLTTSCNLSTSITAFAVLDENATNSSETISTAQEAASTTGTTTAETNTTAEEKEKKETPAEKPEEKPAKPEKPEPNVPPVWKSDIEEFTLKGKTTIDLSQYFYDANNDSLAYLYTTPEKIEVEIDASVVTLTPKGHNFTTTISFTATDGEKATTKEITLIVPENTITINLEYKQGTTYDADNDGYEPTFGIIDLTVEDSLFSWDADETKLCTRWNVQPAESEESTTVCYGSAKCCNFVELAPLRDAWNEVFYSVYGQYGALLNNTISSQIIYADYELNVDEPFAEIYFSDWKELNANYYFASIDFENVCVETCTLTGFNETSYKLIFEIDGATLNLDKLTYSIVEEISNVLVNLAVKDNEGLASGSYQLYKNNEPVAIIEGFVEPDYYDIEVVPTENIVDKLVIENANLTKPLAASIGVDKVAREISIENVDVKKRYAVDLEQLEFEKAVLTATASANSLWKCRQWDYERELCFGSWEMVKELVPGQQYELALTKEDPGFIEGDVNITITPINITGLALAKDIPNITIIVNKNATIDLADYFANIEDAAFTYFEQEGISILFENGIATIIPSKDFAGTVYIYITATKGTDSAISNVFSVNVVNVTVDVTPAIILERKDFMLDEDVELDFEYLTKQELIEHEKWKEEYEVYEEETEKTEAELGLLKQKIDEDEKLLTEEEKAIKKQKKKWQKANDSIEAFVYDNAGNLKEISVEIEELREGKFEIKLPKQRSFKAGKYTIKLDLVKDSIAYSSQQDFTWGVLAINVNKSIYLPNEDAFIGIGVLDDAGKIVCNADVTLEITNPLNQKTILTTANNDIKISPECQVLGVTELPDYYTTYSVNGVGSYLMNLTAVTTNGVRSIQDNFSVQSAVEFDVARQGPTRVYPPVPYTMNISIIANQNYNGLINEYVPSSFEISEVGFIEVEEQPSGITLSAVEDSEINEDLISKIENNKEENKGFRGLLTLTSLGLDESPVFNYNTNKYINLCIEPENNECKGRVAQWREPLSGVRGDAGSIMVRKSRRAHTDLISDYEIEKEEKQAHNLDRVPVWRTGISHEFYLDSEIAESHTVSDKEESDYLNVSVYDNINENPITIENNNKKTTLNLKNNQNKIKNNIANFFTLIPSAQAQPITSPIITTINDTKIISIPANLKKGSKYILSYKFDAPDISPEFYLLGALEIGSFKEARNWQIANDLYSDVTAKDCSEFLITDNGRYYCVDDEKFYKCKDFEYIERVVEGDMFRCLDAKESKEKVSKKDCPFNHPDCNITVDINKGWGRAKAAEKKEYKLSTFHESFYCEQGHCEIPFYFKSNISLEGNLTFDTAAHLELRNISVERVLPGGIKEKQGKKVSMQKDDSNYYLLYFDYTPEWTSPTGIRRIKPLKFNVTAYLDGKKILELDPIAEAGSGSDGDTDCDSVTDSTLISLACTAGDVVVVGVTIEDGGSVSSISWNAGAENDFSRMGRVVTAGTLDVEFWNNTCASTFAANDMVFVVAGANNDDCAMVAVRYSGVSYLRTPNETAGVATSVSVTVGDGSPATDVAMNSDEWAVAVYGSDLSLTSTGPNNTAVLTLDQGAAVNSVSDCTYAEGGSDGSCAMAVAGTTNEALLASVLIPIPPETVKPRINASLDDNKPVLAQVVNMTANVSDNQALSTCNFFMNGTSDGSFIILNKTVTGTNDQCSQNWTIDLSRNNVINFTVVVNDADGNFNISRNSSRDDQIGQVIRVRQKADVSGGSYDNLTAQACNQENDQSVKGTFDQACDTTYPGTCASGVNGVSCNDGTELETFQSSSTGSDWGGINISVYNDLITDCEDIAIVNLCYEWWSPSGSVQSCDISIDADGGTSYTAVTTTCPGTTADPGVTCTDITSLETWICGSFFGETGTRAMAKANGQKSGGGGAKTLTVDALWFNVTYRSSPAAPDTTPPVVNITNLNASDTISFGKRLNITARITGSARTANITFNLTGNDDLYNFSFSLSGATQVISQNITVNVTRGSVINASVVACDAVPNCAINSTLITVADFTPTFTLANNNTAARINDVVQLSALVNDGDTLSMIIASWNCSNSAGTWINISNITLSSTANNYTVNVTNNLPRASTCGWLFYSNDSVVSTFTASTLNTFVIADTTPSFTLANNNTAARINDVVQLSALVDDADTLSMVIASWNGTGTWSNVSNTTASSTFINYTVNLSHTLNRGDTIGWLFYSNDSVVSTFTASTLNTFVIADTAPTFTLANNNTAARINDVVQLSALVNDADTLSMVIASWNGSSTGAWINVSNITLSSTANNYTVNVSVGLARGNTIGWLFYSNDSIVATFTASALNTFVVADTTPTFTLANNNTDPSLNDVVQLSALVNDADTLSMIIASWNGSSTGAWINVSNITLSSTSNNYTVNVSVGLAGGNTIGWLFYGNDSIVSTFTASALNTFAVGDRIPPIVNTSLNKSLTSIFQNDVLNFSVNITDETGLSFCQIIINQSGPNALEFINISLSGTIGQCYNVSKVTLPAGSVINYTIRVNDTSNNFRTNDTIITVASAATTPVVKLNNATFSVDPVAGGNSIILLSFNVTDADGVSDINASKAVVNLTLGPPDIAQFRFNVSDQGGEFGTCFNHTQGTVMIINCTVIMRYYDNASSAWVINVSVQDLGGLVGRNDTVRFTYNSLAAFSLIARGVSEGANLNFTSSFLNDQNVLAKAPILLNNTGNNDFDQINITAAALIGLTTASETIAASQFAVNITNNTAGNGLALSTSPQAIPGIDSTANATLLHGPGISGDSVPYTGVADSRTKGNLSLYFWVDVPSSGLSAQTYNNTWNMTVVDLS